MSHFQFAIRTLCLLALCGVTPILCAQENGMLAPLSAAPVAKTSGTISTGWSFDQIRSDPKRPPDKTKLASLFVRRPRLAPVVRSIRKFDLSSELLTTESLRRLTSESPNQTQVNSQDTTVPIHNASPEQALANSRASVNSRPNKWAQESPAVPARDDQTAPGSAVTSAKSAGLTIPMIPDSMVRGVSFLEPIQDDETDAKTDGQDEKKPTDPKKNKKNTDSDSLSLTAQTVEDLQEQVKSQGELLEANETIDPATRSEKHNQLTIANETLQKAAGFKVEIEKRETEHRRYKDVQKAKKTELKLPLEQEEPKLNKSSSELQMDLQDQRQKLQKLKDDRSNNETQASERENRIKELPGLRTEATDNLKSAKLDKAEQKPAAGDIATTLVLESKELAAQKELESLNKEAVRQVELGVLLPLERSIINRKIKHRESIVAAFEQAYSQKRDAEIQQQQDEAERAASAAIMADPILKTLATSNQQYAKTRGDLTSEISHCDNKTKEADKSLDNLGLKLIDVQSRIETVSGTASASGVELVDFRQNLMFTFESQAEIAKINRRKQVLSLKILSLKERKSELADSEQLIERLYQEREQIKPNPKQDEQDDAAAQKDKEDFKKNAAELIATQIEYLDQLETDYKKLQTSLSNERESLLNLVNRVKQAREYIDKNALWLRSTSPVSLWSNSIESDVEGVDSHPSDIEKSINATQSLLNRDKWGEFATRLTSDVFRRPYESALAAFLLAGLFIVTRRLKDQL